MLLLHDDYVITVSRAP